LTRFFATEGTTEVEMFYTNPITGSHLRAASTNFANNSINKTIIYVNRLNFFAADKIFCVQFEFPVNLLDTAALNSHLPPT
jgi:hypothetical protein